MITMFVSAGTIQNAHMQRTHMEIVYSHIGCAFPVLLHFTMLKLLGVLIFLGQEWWKMLLHELREVYF
jgi:hypothetical protein